MPTSNPRPSLPDVSTVTYAYGLALVLLANVFASTFLSVADSPFSPLIWAGIVANAGGYLSVLIGGREIVLRGGRIALPSTPIPPRARLRVPAPGPLDAWVTPDGAVYFGRSTGMLSRGPAGGLTRGAVVRALADNTSVDR